MGFVRRVTLENLDTFAPLLARSDPKETEVGAAVPLSESAGDMANATPSTDPALDRAEALFAGEPVRVTNRRTRPARGRRTAAEMRPRTGDVARPTKEEASPAENDRRVLVAEIPRGSNRWNQANFDLGTYTRFFGAKIGTQRNVRLQHVESDGSLGAPETRPTVEVKSRNFRLELQAASGLAYPAAGRPIAVFVERAIGDYLYRLVLPTHSTDHKAVSQLLKDQWRGRTDRMRRVITRTSELRRYWPSSPLWNVK